MQSLTPLHLVLLSLGVFLVDSAVLPRSEVDVLSAFKRAIIEDPSGFLSNWNPLQSNPCGWSGIYCSMAGDHIIKLNISGKSLKGFIVPELSQLSALQELKLYGNSLIGAIPKDIGMLKQLKVLDLGSNQLTGSIPPEIGNLGNVIRLNLESNGLTGKLPPELGNLKCLQQLQLKLPPELGNLKCLQQLQLDRNKLTGTLPGSNVSDHSLYGHGRRMLAANGSPVGLCRLPRLQIADFSYNFFVGPVPKCLDYIPRLYFRGNCLGDKNAKQRSAEQCGAVSSPGKTHSVDNTRHIPASKETKHKTGSSKPMWLLSLEIVTGVMVSVLAVIALLIAAQKWKRKPSIIIPWKKSSSSNDFITKCIDLELVKNVVKYSRHELEAACEDFSNIIGSFPDSLVYKGTLKGGPEIAVVSLRIQEESWAGYLDLYFQKEVADLARLNHENVGKLVGYCRETNPFTRMLVFEYASNGTLYEHLHYEEACQFSWTRRMKIILGIARGIKYLHAELDPPFTISELSSSSIYLTDDFSPKLVDFDCWKTAVSRSKKDSDSMVCILPNSMELDIQGNIYAFGILLLEIVSGRPPYSQHNGCIVNWAKDLLESPEVESCMNIVDPQVKQFRQQDVEVICEVVKQCFHPSTANISELCSMLENRIQISVSAEIRASSLAWAELVLYS